MIRLFCRNPHPKKLAPNHDKVKLRLFIEATINSWETRYEADQKVHKEWENKNSERRNLQAHVSRLRRHLDS